MHRWKDNFLEVKHPLKKKKNILSQPIEKEKLSRYRKKGGRGEERKVGSLRATLVLDLISPLTAFYSVRCITAIPSLIFILPSVLHSVSISPRRCFSLFLRIYQPIVYNFFFSFSVLSSPMKWKFHEPRRFSNNRKLIQNSRVKIFNISIIIFLKRNTGIHGRQQRFRLGRKQRRHWCSWNQRWLRSSKFVERVTHALYIYRWMHNRWGRVH